MSQQQTQVAVVDDTTWTLYDYALDILTTADVVQKAHRTKVVVAKWKAGEIPLDGLVSTSERVPDRPNRPTQLMLLSMHAMKSGTRKALIHSVAHAESVAIDLMWDLVARFGYDSDDASSDSKSEKHKVTAQLPRPFYDDWVKIAGGRSAAFLSLA